MIIPFKKLNDKAVTPTKAHESDAGFDLTATSVELDVRYPNTVTYGTGIAVEIPKYYVGLLFPRSSVYKKDLVLSNCVGVIDSGYRGEIKLKFRQEFPNLNRYKDGDKVGQLIIMPYLNADLKEVEELSNTDRGEGGFGSTDKQ